MKILITFHIYESFNQFGYLDGTLLTYLDWEYEISPSQTNNRTLNEFNLNWSTKSSADYNYILRCDKTKDDVVAAIAKFREKFKCDKFLFDKPIFKDFFINKSKKYIIEQFNVLLEASSTLESKRNPPPPLGNASTAVLTHISLPSSKLASAETSNLAFTTSPPVNQSAEENEEDMGLQLPLCTLL